MKNKTIINLPLYDDIIYSLHAGNIVYFNGIIYTARDAAHKRIVSLLNNNKRLPFNLENATIFYAGPGPAPKNDVIGAIGPTTSSRMDEFTPQLLKAGLKGIIGKGKRNLAVKNALIQNKAVYFSAFSGTAALIKKSIIKAECIAFEDLGPEAVYKLNVNNLKAIVVNDIHGNDLYE